MTAEAIREWAVVGFLAVIDRRYSSEFSTA
jgi:hypothetical protein